MDKFGKSAGKMLLSPYNNGKNTIKQTLFFLYLSVGNIN